VSPTGKAENGPQHNLVFRSFARSTHVCAESGPSRFYMELAVKIPLRSPELARRQTERYDRIAPDWPHYKRLKAQAVLFGYSSWEELVESCQPSAPDFPYDQDIDRASREARWLWMAQAISAAFDVELPHALNLVAFIAPTNDPLRPRPPWYEPNDTFNFALSTQDGLYWCCVGEHGHPFVPPGFILQQATHVSDLCQERLRNPYGMLPRKSPRRDIWVLLPDEGIDLSGGIRPRHTYFRRGQLLEVDPVPMGDVIRSPSKHAAQLREFFEYSYPDIGQTEQRALIDEWRRALKSLHVAADLPAGSKRRWVQPTVSARRRIGKEWYWPLQITPVGDALATAAQYAHEVDTDLLDHFGRDPGYIQIS